MGHYPHRVGAQMRASNRGGIPAPSQLRVARRGQVLAARSPWRLYFELPRNNSPQIKATPAATATDW